MFKDLLEFLGYSKTNNQPTRKAKPMPKKKKKPVYTYSYLENWDTRYGMSQRVVVRQGGKFVDNISLTALKRGAKVTSR